MIRVLMLMEDMASLDFRRLIISRITPARTLLLR